MTMASVYGLKSQSIKELEIRYHSERIDSNKAKLAFRIGEKHWFSRNIQEAIIYLKLATELNASSKFKTNEVNGLHLLANAYYKQENYDLAFHSLDKAYALALKYQEFKFIPLIEFTYATIYKILGDYVKATNFAISSIKSIKKSNFQDVRIQIGYSYNMLGNIMEAQKQDSLALEYYQTGYHEVKDIDPNQAQNLLLNLANIHFKLKNYSEAKKILLEVVENDTIICHSDDDMYAFLNLSELAKLENNKVKCLHYINAALEYSKSKNLDLDYHAILNKLTSRYIDFNDINKADSLIEFIQTIKNQNEKKHLNLQNLLNQSKIAIARGNYKEAYNLNARYQQIKDSISSAEQSKTIHKLEILYRTEEKEHNINQLKDLAILEETKKNRNYLIGGLLFLGLATNYLWSVRNNKVKVKIHAEEVKNLMVQQQVVALQSMINGQETERTRIARELHDGLGGLLSATKMHFMTINQSKLENSNKEPLQKCLELLDRSNKDLREIAHSMMPEILLQKGLTSALQSYCDQLNGSRIISFEFHHFGIESRLKNNVEIIIYRIIQELLNNILKHSNASKAIVQISKEQNKLFITVEDDGIGFKLDQNDQQPSAGIKNIRERIYYLNGNLSIDSKEGIGTTVYIEVAVD